MKIYEVICRGEIVCKGSYDKCVKYSLLFGGEVVES